MSRIVGTSGKQLLVRLVTSWRLKSCRLTAIEVREPMSEKVWKSQAVVLNEVIVECPFFQTINPIWASILVAWVDAIYMIIFSSRGSVTLVPGVVLCPRMPSARFFCLFVCVCIVTLFSWYVILSTWCCALASCISGRTGRHVVIGKSAGVPCCVLFRCSSPSCLAMWTKQSTTNQKTASDKHTLTVSQSVAHTDEPENGFWQTHLDG